MAFPIIKLLIVGFRQTSRPINNLLVKIIKSRGADSFMTTGMMAFGQRIHQYEVRLNRYISKEEHKLDNESQEGEAAEEIKLYIKPLSSNKAFNKGVEWFSEIFFFYGILMALAAYEVGKAQKASEDNAKRIKK